MKRPGPSGHFATILTLLLCPWLIVGANATALADATDCVPQSETIALAGGELAYLRADGGATGKPGLLLLHGLFASPPTLPAEQRAAPLGDYRRRLGHYRQV